MRLGDPSNQRRSLAIGAWIVLAVLAFAKAATTSDQSIQALLVITGCVLLLCAWFGLRRTR